MILPFGSQALARVGARGPVLLAAAMADFFVPIDRMAADKNQSRSKWYGLALQLQNTPQILGYIRGGAAIVVL